ncbi:MAG: hypothetical protein GY870_22015 [archaeon]|nr:hypothetical protein [archaeon]
MPRCKNCRIKSKNLTDGLCESCHFELKQFTTLQEIQSILENKEKTGNCSYCNIKLDDITFRCKFCGQKFCHSHRIVENHHCYGLYDYDKNQYFKFRDNYSISELYNDLIELDRLKEAYRKSDENLIILKKIAHILLKIHKPGVSLEIYDKILKSEPNNATIWYKKGIVLEKLNKNKNDAANCFKIAYELDPSNIKIRNKHNQYNNYENIPDEVLQHIQSIKNNNDKKISSIEEQLDIIRKTYDIKVISEEEGIFNIRLGEKFSITIILKDYPARPEIQFPIHIEEKIGNIYIKLRSLLNWSNSNGGDVLGVLNELKAFLGLNGYGKILIFKDFMDSLVKTAKQFYPSEMMGFLQMDRWVIWRLREPQNFTSTPGYAAFSSKDIPQHDSVIGMVHSHTIGPAIPSEQDLITFKKFKINIIYSNLMNELKIYDSLGSSLSFGIIDLFGKINNEEDYFKKREENQSKKNMYT